jgi:hypothetical protein
MKRRWLLALFLVVGLVAGPSLLARAGNKGPVKCWWVKYQVAMWGTEVFAVGPNCVPCFWMCHNVALPPPPGTGHAPTQVPARSL